MDSEKNYRDRSRHKFHRPDVVKDYVPRGALERQIVESGAAPILVVTAPAGYGKSSLVSNWIDHSDISHTWVSLDSGDNDLKTFVGTLATAFQETQEIAAERLARIWEAPQLPTAELLADLLSAALEQTLGPCALVLDDYHEIRSTDVHDFVDALLVRRPDTFRIAIIGRRTPSLTLGRLRSQGLVTDVRLADLQLDEDAQANLVSAVVDVDLDPGQKKKLNAITEGWPAGVRLFLLSRPGGQDLASYLESFDGPIWQVQEYLMEEVLSALPETVSEAILRTSILRRICPELCDAILENADDVGTSGQDVVDTVTRNNLFYIPLSQRGQWFRYHHLFQDLLLDLLRKKKTARNICELHYEAARWYDRNDYPEDAIHHFLQAGDESAAADVVTKFGASLKATQQWARLDQVLGMLSRSTVEGSAELLMLLACASDKAGRIAQMVDLVQRAEAVCREQGDGGSTTFAQICAVRSSIELHFGKADAALASANFALHALPQTFSYERGVALYISAYAQQVLGRGAEGFQALLHELESAQNDSEKAQIFFAQCFLGWASGDLEALIRDAANLRALGDSDTFNETYQWGAWYGGGANYLRDDLDAAEKIIERTCREAWPAHMASYAFCINIQALVYAARGDIRAGQELTEALVRKMTSTGSTSYLPDTQAIDAELAFRGKDDAAALSWARSDSFDAPLLGWGFVSPGLKAARILILAGGTSDQRGADSILRSHEEFYGSTHNDRYLAETLALRALHSAKAGVADAALVSLSRAIELALPGRMTRIFIDLGPEIAPLLNRLDASEQTLTFIGEILAAFDTDQVADLPDALSKREQEVLALLSDRLSNKEIGEKLFISPATVKRHTNSIYQKLRVSDRHEAVAKANGLGLLA